MTLPKLTDIFSSWVDGFKAVFGISELPKYNVIEPMSSVLSGKEYSLRLAIADVAKDSWVDTCGADMLNRFGLVKLNRTRAAAVQGEYTCTIAGTTGAVIARNTTFQGDDDSASPGYLFVLDSAYTMPGATGTITLRALTGGLVSQLLVGDTLTTTTPIPNVTGVATVTAVTSAPLDEESVEDFRRKIIDAFRLTAGSWSAADYRLVGSQATGVKQIYAYRVSGSSCAINVFVEGNTDGVAPTADVIDAVETAIEAKRPLGVTQVNYAACPIKNIKVNVRPLADRAFTTTERSVTAAAITSAIQATRPFIAAADSVARRADTLAINYGVVGVVNLYQVVAEAIPGVPFEDVEFKVNDVVTTSYTFDNGEIPYTQLITFDE